MGLQLEYFDIYTNIQKEVFQNLLSMQKEMRVQWIEILNKTQSAITRMPGLPENAQTREALNQFNAWYATMASSSKSATEDVLKTQESWIDAYEKQLAISRSVLRERKVLSKTNNPVQSQGLVA